MLSMLRECSANCGRGWSVARIIEASLVLGLKEELAIPHRWHHSKLTGFHFGIRPSVAADLKAAVARLNAGLGPDQPRWTQGRVVEACFFAQYNAIRKLASDANEPHHQSGQQRRANCDEALDLAMALIEAAKP